ncbi:MAG: SigE family RNA polymerase sigma factor [Acidimicrobiales bacterium]
MGLLDRPSAQHVTAASAAPAPEGSFEEFYRAQYEPMLRLAYLLTQSHAVAEDLVQDSFIRIHPRWGTLDTPVAYLRRTVANACYSFHRRRKREAAPAGAAPPRRAPPHDEMWDALAALAPRRRAVLVLRYYLDLSEAEIAATIGCRPGTVKSLTSRALQDLRSVVDR